MSGVNLSVWINRKMMGRIGCTPEEIDFLVAYLDLPGDHVEVGCLWGGTAILAALVKQQGIIYSIDPMTGGWWDSEDPITHTRPNPGAVLSNLQEFGIAHRVNLIRTRSRPWPLPETILPATFFIDGDHAYETCRLDWHVARKITQRRVVFHDCDQDHQGVAQAVREAMQERNWRRQDQAGSMVMFERVMD